MIRKILIYIISFIILILLLIIIKNAFFVFPQGYRGEPIKYFDNDIPYADYTKENPNGDRVNTSKKISKSTEFKNIKCNGLKITSKKDNYSIAELEFTLTNNSSLDYSGKYVVIYFNDKNNKEINSIVIEIDSLKAGEQIKINKSIIHRIIDSYSYRFEVVDELSGA